MTVHGERRENYTDGMSDEKWPQKEEILDASEDNIGSNEPNS